MTSLREFGAMAGMPVTKSALILRVGLRVRWTPSPPYPGQLPSYRADPDESHKGILAIGDIIGRLFFRLIEGTPALSPGGNRWISKRGSSSRFWRADDCAAHSEQYVLDVADGLITALAAGIALLWEDYQT